MSNRLDAALQDSIRRLEAGETLESVLARYPEHAESLREDLRLVGSLNAGLPAVSGHARGRSRVLMAASAATTRGGLTMNSIGSYGLRAAGAVALVAVAMIGIAYLSGNLHVQVGDEAVAQSPHECLDQVLGNLDSAQDGVFNVDDILAMREAFETQNTDPRYDRDGDGDVDIDDLMVYIQELKACFTSGFPSS